MVNFWSACRKNRRSSLLRHLSVIGAAKKPAGVKGIAANAQELARSLTHYVSS
jgi:hypothetical protein